MAKYTSTLLKGQYTNLIHSHSLSALAEEGQGGLESFEKIREFVVLERELKGQPPDPRASPSPKLQTPSFLSRALLFMWHQPGGLH